jgi:uncharacterized protein
MTAPVPLALAALTVYPVKSLRGFALKTSEVGSEGLAEDRRWMLVDANDRFVSQRELPELATLPLRFAPGQLDFDHPTQGPLSVRLPMRDAPVRRVRVWGDTLAAQDAGDAIAAWLEGVYERPLRLVAFTEHSARLADSTYAAATPIRFSDGFPLLLINQASLNAVNAATGFSLGAERFRANLVLTGLSAFAEDQLERVVLGDIELRLVKPCTRCAIVGIDPQTGQRSMDPLPWLKQQRFDTSLRGATFGWNAIVTRGIGSVLSLQQTGLAYPRVGA